jgi:hypothetical protein
MCALTTLMHFEPNFGRECIGMDKPVSLRQTAGLGFRFSSPRGHKLSLYIR